MSKINKKEEAIKRMKALDLMPECIDAFESKNEVWISETQGALFDLSKRPEIQKEISEFEEKHNALVYHCILNIFNGDILITMFYVCDEKEEWELDWADIKDGFACCFVANLNDPICSEIGSIQFKKINGGLKRIA